MSYPPEKKLFIGDIKRLNIAALMNTVKLIDPYANFYPDANKKFGFIHMTTAERCNEIYHKLLNSMYNGKYITVERPKGYVEPRVATPPITVTPINANIKTSFTSTGTAWKAIDPELEQKNKMDLFKARMEARQKAINEAERVKAAASASAAIDVAAIEAAIEAEAIKAAKADAIAMAAAEADHMYNIEQLTHAMKEANNDAYVDSLFALPSFLLAPMDSFTPIARRQIMNPEEDCY